MALQESLSRFKQQQEKCQTTLTNIAARAPPKASSHKKAPARVTPAIAPRPAVKFSNDTERLQHINAIRKSPVGAQIKRVIDLLYETRHAHTPEQINESTYVDIKNNKAVFDSLKNNTKVSYDGRRFSYKSKHDLVGKDDTLRLIRKFPEGLAVVDVKDAYPTVLEDLQVLSFYYIIRLLIATNLREIFRNCHTGYHGLAFQDEVDSVVAFWPLGNSY